MYEYVRVCTRKYEKVVVAIDLSEASVRVVKKALKLVAGDASKLALACNQSLQVGERRPALLIL